MSDPKQALIAAIKAYIASGDEQLRTEASLSWHDNYLTREDALYAVLRDLGVEVEEFVQANGTIRYRLMEAE